MDSKDETNEKLVETGQVDANGMGNGTCKAVSEDKRSLEKYNKAPIDESKENSSQNSKIFILDRLYSQTRI
jgi:hypothetical protein